MNRTQVIAGLVALCAIALFAYLMIPLIFPRPAADAQLPRRRGGSSTIRLPERWPSAGLAWSKKNYAEQYAAVNWTTVAFTGLEDFENERFLDVGARAYSREFASKFSYTDPNSRRPEVRLAYLRRAETFVGRLTGHGLKPNFAYQIKLRGIFSDQTAFERIGRLGRWRLPGRGTNYLDSVYEAFPFKELVESYLLFDFAITNPQGQLDKEFYADSTLHVLWNLNYQRVPRPTDTRPLAVFRESADRLLYSNPRPDLSTQMIFAESEQHALAPNNRPPVNETFLPIGKYTAELALTEESFHGYGDNGFWATVMVAPVEFEVVDRPHWSPYWTAIAAEGVSLSLAHASLECIRKEACADDLLTGTATTDKPFVVFAEELNLAPGERYVLALDIQASGSHGWQIFIDKGRRREEQPAYVIESDGGSGWQRFEVEITSQTEGQIRLAPGTRRGRIGVRNVGIYKVVAP